MSGMNVLKVGPDRIIGSRDMGVRQVAPGKPSSPGLRYIILDDDIKNIVLMIRT